MFRNEARDEHEQALQDGAGQVPRDDLVDNPGIGATKGTEAGKADPELIEGASTSEGDVANDTNPQGGVDPRQLGRTNK